MVNRVLGPMATIHIAPRQPLVLMVQHHIVDQINRHMIEQNGLNLHQEYVAFTRFDIDQLDEAFLLERFGKKIVALVPPLVDARIVAQHNAVFAPVIVLHQRIAVVDSVEIRTVYVVYRRVVRLNDGRAFKDKAGLGLLDADNDPRHTAVVAAGNILFGGLGGNLAMRMPYRDDLALYARLDIINRRNSEKVARVAVDVFAFDELGLYANRHHQPTCFKRVTGGLRRLKQHKQRVNKSKKQKRALLQENRRTATRRSHIWHD